MVEQQRSQLKIGICGLGTVASGVINVIQRNGDLIGDRTGSVLELRHVGARRDNPNCDVSGIEVSRDIFAVADDQDVDVLVELIGGTTTAYELVMRAIENGKHVVTANKALIATHGDRILKAASEHNVRVAFEAAVAGGIPVIKALREGLSANRIESIAGIINGTGNFILSEMRDKGRSFEEALADAQALGYAEADPTFDVEGIDAAQKLVILSALAFSTGFDADACFTEGIGSLKVEDIRFAESMGYRVKHLGIAKHTSTGLELRVHPCLIPEAELLASVHGVMNAVAVQADAVGKTLYYGPGAGSEPTASAVVADLADLARDLAGGQENFSIAHGGDDVPIREMDSVQTPWYLRVPVEDKPGVLSDITQTLSESGISIQAMQQPDTMGGQAQLILTTNKVAQHAFHEALDKIRMLDCVVGELAAIRIELFD